MTVWPSASKWLGAVIERGRAGFASSTKSARFPRAAVWPSTIPVTPLPVQRAKIADVCRARRRVLLPPRESRRQADVRSRVREWPRRAAFRGHSRIGAAMSDVTRGLPSVSVPVLSTTSVSTFSRISSASAFLIEHAGESAAARADHDGHRRGEAERAGARDDQHGDGVQQRVRHSRRGAQDSPTRRR